MTPDPSTSSEHEEGAKQDASLTSTPHRQVGLLSNFSPRFLHKHHEDAPVHHTGPGGAQVQWLLQITQHSGRPALPFQDSPGSSGQAGPADESSVEALLQKSACVPGALAFLSSFCSVSYRKRIRAERVLKERSGT